MDFKLSILLVTYNHEQHIEDALKALFKQTLPGPIELVIADDCSSDNTLTIIKKYDGMDSRFVFKYLDADSNLGITKNYQRGFAACTGEYIAVLEGDDYWISPLKLRFQSDFLDNHWECDLCSVNYFVYECDTAHFRPRTTTGGGFRLIDARQLIADNLVGNFSTCMYRKNAIDALPSALFETVSYDWIINICIARRSLIGFLETPMSVYRLHPLGIWSQDPRVEKLKKQLQSIPIYDELTEYVFRDDFRLLASRLRQAVGTAHIDQLGRGAAQPLKRALPVLSDYTPPLLKASVLALLPPVCKRLLHRLIRRGPTA